MSISAAFRDFLEQHGVACAMLSHPGAKTAREAAEGLGVDPNTLARLALLADERGVLMAVYPAAYALDLTALNRELGRRLKPVDAERARRELPNCLPGRCPPLAAFHGVGALVHESLVGVRDVYFALTPQVLCRVSGRDFCRMQGPAWYGSEFARPRAAPPERSEVEARRLRIRQRLENVDKLPAMPRVAEEILQVGANPYANASDLASVIEQDPSLTAQLIRCANSPFYGYRGKVDSIRDVIARVLGYDMVIDIALGIAVGRALRNPAYGPLGLTAYWRHATYCAALTQTLGAQIGAVTRPRQGMTYLGGLLHNFGILLLGHLWPDEFRVLNNAVAKHPAEPVPALETRLLGVTHAELGVWLMEAWDMPGELVTVVREHHNPEYDGPDSVYVWLTLVANRLLQGVGLGDERNEQLPGTLLKGLGIHEDNARQALARVLEQRDSLDAMARQMAA